MLKGKKSALDKIQEEEEKASIKSGNSAKKELEASAAKSQASVKEFQPPVGTVSKEFEAEINSKFEDCYASIETNKEVIE